MKASLFTLALLLAGMFFVAGCRKDLSRFATESSFPILAGQSKHKVHERPLKATMGVYHIYTPDSINGGCYCPPYLPGYMAGEGEGNSTLLGKFYSYSNWYALYDATGTQVTYSVPLTGAYYDQLRPWFTEVEMQTIEDKVEVIFFDRQGNSIWSEIDVLSMTPAPDNRLHFTISGTGKITGGTGKFATTTTGFYNFSGVSDIFQDSAPGVRYQYSWFSMEGKITY